MLQTHVLQNKATEETQTCEPCLLKECAIAVNVNAIANV